MALNPSLPSNILWKNLRAIDAAEDKRTQVQLYFRRMNLIFSSLTMSELSYLAPVFHHQFQIKPIFLHLALFLFQM
jgi:hypothetical protein